MIESSGVVAAGVAAAPDAALLRPDSDYEPAAL